jgi:HKD family nuclease
MAELNFILQAVTSANHANAVRWLLRLQKPTQVLISVAFVQQDGIDALTKAIKPPLAKVRFFVGIRNGITSVQAIRCLLAMHAEVYAVDTGARSPIFHPKLYLAANAKQARVVVGSANLTWAGMYDNIEASTIMRLDLSNAGDRRFVEETVGGFAEMLKNHPQHVFLIKNRKQADELFRSGRLADEEVTPAPNAISRVETGARDRLPRMKLMRGPRHPTRVPPTKPPVAVVTRPGVSFPTGAASVGRYLVWKSNALRERDLNIPHGKGTHATGSMGLKKGALSGIDQRHYFREQVFPDLRWIQDRRPKSWERAEARFELVIKNLNYGFFDLKLSHNTDKRSVSYRQGNFMTQLHWGNAKRHIAKKDLLGRTMSLYRRDVTPPGFMIEID